MIKKTKSKKASKKSAKKAKRQISAAPVPYDERMPGICIDGDEYTSDPRSFSQSDDSPWVVDVACSKCGRSGFVPIGPSSIQW